MFLLASFLALMYGPHRSMKKGGGLRAPATWWPSDYCFPHRFRQVKVRPADLYVLGIRAPPLNVDGCVTDCVCTSAYEEPCLGGAKLPRPGHLCMWPCVPIFFVCAVFFKMVRSQTSTSTGNEYLVRICQQRQWCNRSQR